MDIDLIRREIISLCMIDGYCLKKVKEQRLKYQLFEGYEKHYLALISHAEKTTLPFNVEGYVILNKDIGEMLFENKLNPNDIDDLIKALKVKTFKNYIYKKIDNVSNLLKSNEPTDVSKAYNIMREEIEIYGNESNGSTFGELARSYDMDRKREFLNVGYKTFENLNIENTDLVIIAGRPAMGKTAFIINLLARIKKKGLFISLEMGDNQIMDRVVSYMSGGVPMERIINKTLTDNQKEKVKEGLEKIETWETEIKSDTGFELHTIIREMEKAVSRGCQYIMLDYLQLVRNQSSKNRNLEVSDISISFKEFAKKFKVPVIALSQLSRNVESRTDKRPMLSDLRDSGRLTACYTFSYNRRGLLKVS